GGRGGDADPGGEHDQRHRPWRVLRPHLGRQDRDDRQLRGRVVLRLPSVSRGNGVDRLSERRDPHDVRARDFGLGPDVPGDDLAAVHGEGERLRAVPEGLPGRALVAGVGVAPPPVRDERRVFDVHLYQRYTESLLHGHVPYRDFFMEYPPGALAVFVPPAAATNDHYNAAFKGLMALCGMLALVLVAFVLLRLDASVTRMWIAVP